jgi:hypothetical protein
MIDLIHAYQRAKATEDAAKAERQELGQKIADALEHPAEGQKTHQVGAWSVTVKQPINRKVDWTAFDAAMIGCETPPPTIPKRELDVMGLRWYADTDPERHLALLDSITATPGMPQITIKEKANV